VEEVSLRLGRGEIVALVGPNGSGKTTLAKLAAGLLEPHAGQVERRGRACYLSQDPGRYLVRERADEEVALAVDGDLARAREALRAVGLAGFEGRHPRDLSSGERERLALAAVLVADPDLLVLDEPTRGVDPPRKDELAALLRAQASRRATLVVTNDLVFSPDDAALALLLVAGGLIVAGAAWLESGPGSSKELVLIATLAAAAAAGRVLFAAVPNVQPVTVTAVVAGVALGPRAGASVGALAALVSNFYLGQGAYTPWQMLAWGGCGLVGGLAAPLLRRRLPLALTCFALGFAFDLVMDLWEWLSFYPHTWQAFTALYARGLPFDVAHATGNFVLALAAGPELRRLLERYARRLKTVIVWA
jgi:energy-coupling factor transport system substrate-specific component